MAQETKEPVKRNVIFPARLYEDLKLKAEKDNRSIQRQIIVAIEEHLARRKRNG